MGPPEDSFAACAVRLCPLAARVLGWTPDIFWNATPGELALCLGTPGTAAAPLARGELDRLIERDRDG